MRAAREGYSAGAWLQSLREAGAGIRRQVGLRLYANAKRIVAEYGEEPFRELSEVPSVSETPPLPTKGATGILQHVRLQYRERVTNNVRDVYFNVKSDEGMTRQEAINAAIEAYAPHSERYQTVLLGAVHTGAVKLVPVNL
jgi:hypothetical protein